MGWRLEVIQFHDEANTSVVARVPPDGTADIKYGAQLIVNQNQEAIFFNDGKAMDTFGPGRYTLTTKNLPIITRILTIPWEKSPFQACVYYIGKQTFVDQKWGTRQPIIFRDKDFGVVRLRSFGKYTFRVTDGALLLNTLVGTQGKYTTEEITAFQRDIIVMRLTDLLGSLNVGLLDLAPRYDEIAAAAKERVADDFAKYGLELVDFFINAINPPEEVQQAIDARGAMGAVGNLNEYMRYQTGKSLGKMSESGQAPQGMGFGLGMAIPGMLGGAPAGIPVSTPQPQSSQGIPDAIQSRGQSSPRQANERLELGQLGGAASNPQEAVKAAATASGFSLNDLSSEYILTVPIGTLRKQQVHVAFDRADEAGHPLVTIWSACGPASDRNALTLLRFNSKLVYGAFAVQKSGDGEALVLTSNVLADSLTPAAVTQIVSAIAWQADQVEEKISGKDTF
jgi:membrane protease subunit (stomatin/prohibitin family)